MTLRATSVLFGTALLFAGLAAPLGNAQGGSLPVKAVHVTDLSGVKVKATYDFAKRAAHVADENFFSPEHE